MTTQSEILKTVNKTGFYSARLYVSDRSVRGLNEVNPAKKMVKKGQLKLIKEDKEVRDGMEIVDYTWAKI